MMNCVVFVEILIEVEFFGYEVGVFIGVIKVCEGWFEEVDGGILFFDEFVMFFVGV